MMWMLTLLRFTWIDFYRKRKFSFVLHPTKYGKEKIKGIDDEIK